MKPDPRPAGLLRSAFLALLLAAPAAAQNASTLVSLTAYGNLDTAGVVVTISGDADGDATATLEWRLASGAYRPAQPLERTSGTRLAGRLFWLSPGTAYEARVTLSDPESSPTRSAAGT